MQKQRRAKAVLNMHVPEHISVTGESLKINGFDPRRMEERQRMMEMMNVPDKIVVAGGDRYVGYQSDPRDAMGDIRVPETQTNNLEDLPSRLTLANTPIPEEDYPLPDESMSASSLAVDANPLKEVKIMKRQLACMAVTIHDMNAEVNKLKSERMYWYLSVLACAVVTVFSMFRR